MVGMPPPSITTACSVLQNYIKQKCSKLNLAISPDLPPYVPPRNLSSTTPSTPSSTPSTSSNSSNPSQPSRDILALTYDVLYAVMEEVMLVDAKVKGSVDQANSYLRRLSQVLFLFY
jgi:hypothetical protein